MVSVAYNVSHKVPWHWQVPAYLTTKAVGAGAFLVLAVALLFGVEASPLARVAIGAVGILATLATTGLLVSDLERPERFLRILTRPQWKSWLTRGAFVLIGFSAVSGLWWASELGSWLGLYTMPPISSMGLAVLTLPLAIGAAVYTAFLFAQCEGRDLWQSPLLPFHLLVQSVVGGAAAIAMTTLFVDAPALAEAARWTLFGGLALDLFVTLTGEFGVAHASEVAARAAHAISHGKYKKLFWGGAVGIGHVAPLLLLLAPVPAAAALAAVLAIVGLYAYEHAFVMAPQEIPNS
jgi:formate-dependent nitrite reductase membrane component NrfD